jgi:hypothetical protein
MPPFVVSGGYETSSHLATHFESGVRLSGAGVHRLTVDQDDPHRFQQARTA